MRKIKFKEDVDKKRRRNQIIIGVVLVSLMLFSTIGYSFIQNSGNDGQYESESYNGLTFYRINDLWQTSIQGQTFSFQYLPQEVSNISVFETLTLQNISGNPLYLVNSENYASQKIIGNIGQYALRYQTACLEGTNCTEWPIKTCEENLIIFNEANATSVAQVENCIFISGDFDKGSDAFLYRLLGII